MLNRMQSDESFNDDFCVQLEYHLPLLMEKVAKGFWCDGVLMPNNIMISKKRINDTRKVETIAWTGKTGQERYNLIIHFGKYSLRRYAKGKSLLDCLPEIDDNALKIDIANKQLELYLK